MCKLKLVILFIRFFDVGVKVFILGMCRGGIVDGEWVF